MTVAFPDASGARYQIGDVIVGKYRLSGLLGEGGMGAVWAAVNLQLESPVAIKVLVHRDQDREVLTLRLKQEAKATARLGHPAIVRVFDIGETERGDAFIVMELLKGQSLAARLAHAGCLPATQAVQLLLPVADALSVAHAKGIVHRDLKPDNVFIVDDEQQLQPKLVDFGIAKIAGPASDQTRLTQGNAVLGSPDYMSPEQARGLADVDHRTDIWSFCVVLYEAVSGRTPFSATNYNALLRGVIEDEPEPLVGGAADAQELWAILQRGLAKDPDARFASMTDLGRELAVWLLGKGINEDVCGSSLESKWLLRSSDRTAARPVPEAFRSWPSLPPEPPRRPQSDDGSVSGDGPTIEAGSEFSAAPTPVGREEIRARPRLVRRASVAVGAIASLGVASALVLRNPERSPKAASSARSSADISSARPTLDHVFPAAGPVPEPGSEPIEPRTVPASNPAQSASLRPRAKAPQRARPAPSAAASVAPPRASDLLTPY